MLAYLGDYHAEYASFCAPHHLHPFDLGPFLEFKPSTRLAQYKFMIENPFITAHFPILETFYCRAVRRFNALRRFVLTVRRARLPNKTTVDLSLEPLSKYRKSELFEMVDHGVKYTFRTTDLLNMVHAALTSSVDVISKPQFVKNPYTGQKFSIETMYLLYLHVRLGPLQMPRLLALFIESECKLDAFLTQNECLLRGLVIKSLVDHFPPETMRDELLMMFDNLKFYNAGQGYKSILRNMHSLPAEVMGQFKPWLHLYFQHLYSLNPDQRHNSFAKLVRQMVTFKTENPEFGLITDKKVNTQVKNLSCLTG
jgi:hypothetical protein